MRENETASADGPQDLLPLPPAAMYILVALAEAPSHGYRIMSEVEELSGGVMRLGPGTLYGSIKRMLGQRLIEELDERPDPALDDERRRYYQLTPLGAAGRGRRARAPDRAHPHRRQAAPGPAPAGADVTSGHRPTRFLSRGLVWLMPRALRDEYGPDMVQLALDRLRTPARPPGGSGPPSSATPPW